ncbi:MAG: histidine phosphatase family protein [Candidatus Eremiobacteraeota bacterium]|nr:histidine phosphatase family protein [Candidatus Eremiobacteraeota bacterium]
MNCYFLRHGIAVDSAEWHGSDDDRPLTAEGSTRMEREAKAIAELLPDLELIVTSPLVRARQTAQFVAERLRLRNVVEDGRIAHGFNARACQAILTAHPDAESVMLVGHEPSMSATIGHMIGDGNVELKKAALAGVELAERTSTSGTLIFLIPPKVLAKWGRSIHGQQE